MDSILKKGLFLVTVTGAITAFPIMAQAADIDDTQDMPTAGIEQVLGECYTSEKTISVKDYLVPTQKGEYLDMAFANVQSFLYIRSDDRKRMGRKIISGLRGKNHRPGRRMDESAVG